VVVFGVLGAVENNCLNTFVVTSPSFENLKKAMQTTLHFQLYGFSLLQVLYQTHSDIEEFGFHSNGMNMPLRGFPVKLSPAFRKSCSK
jgi:hypothetical protein